MVESPQELSPEISVPPVRIRPPETTAESEKQASLSGSDPQANNLHNQFRPRPATTQEEQQQQS